MGCLGPSEYSVMAQAPKLLAHFPATVENIAAGCINVKATTTEKPGFAGNEEIVGANFR